MRKGMIPLILCLAVSALSQAAEDDRYAEWTRVKVGERVPAFTYTTLAGDKVASDQLEGRVLFINLFATWCGPCRSEMPHLQMLYQETKRKDFVMVAIGREHSEADLMAFKRQYKLTFPMAQDPKRKIYGLFAEKYIPRNVVVGKDGIVKWHAVGFTEASFARMQAVLERELSRETESDRQ